MHTYVSQSLYSHTPLCDPTYRGCAVGTQDKTTAAGHVIYVVAN